MENNQTITYFGKLNKDIIFDYTKKPVNDTDLKELMKSQNPETEEYFKFHKEFLNNLESEVDTVNLLGPYRYPDGSYYKGEFKNKKKHGLGEEFLSRSGVYYLGFWEKGERKGRCFLIKECGGGKLSVYSSNDINGKIRPYSLNIDGQGILYRPNNQIKYKGDFLNDKREGKGEYFFEDGSVYKGDWKDGKREGKGVYLFKTGARYEGEWKDNSCDGEGIMKYANRVVYEGEWADGKWNGEGRLDKANGNVYEGDWVDSKKDGRILHFFRETKISEGVYEEGKKIGFETCYISNGERFYVENIRVWNSPTSLTFLPNGKYNV